MLSHTGAIESLQWRAPYRIGQADEGTVRAGRTTREALSVRIYGVVAGYEDTLGFVGSEAELKVFIATTESAFRQLQLTGSSLAAH